MTSWPNYLLKWEIGDFQSVDKTALFLLFPFLSPLLSINCFVFHAWTVFSLTVVFLSFLVSLHVLLGEISLCCEFWACYLFQPTSFTAFKVFCDSPLLIFSPLLILKRTNYTPWFGRLGRYDLAHACLSKFSSLQMLCSRLCQAVSCVSLHVLFLSSWTESPQSLNPNLVSSYLSSELKYHFFQKKTFDFRWCTASFTVSLIKLLWLCLHVCL